MNAADSTGISAFADFLNYGALGALALICIIVLGLNVWKLYDVVNRASAEKAKAVAPLLRFQMMVCAVGFVLASFAAIYLGLEQAKAERHVILAISPREFDVGPDYRPVVKIGGKEMNLSDVAEVACQPRTMVDIKLDKYINYAVRNRVSEGIQNRQAGLTLPSVAPEGI